MQTRRLFVAAAVAAALWAPALAQEKSIIVASTTSTEDSGLFGHILPIFRQATGIDVKVIAQGTGQALDTARRGDADVAFVHARAAEEKFVQEGAGVKRFPVMYNDFVLIGPKNDPAGVKGMKDISKALQAIKDKRTSFISRGDRSGTAGRRERHITTTKSRQPCSEKSAAVEITGVVETAGPALGGIQWIELRFHPRARALRKHPAERDVA